MSSDPVRDMQAIGVSLEATPGGLRVDVSELKQSFQRVAWAAGELESAWRAVPPRARQAMGVVTVTLNPDDTQPTDGEVLELEGRVRRHG